MKKTVGIIGGMGPAATCDLMEKIIALTKASRDQDHLHIITDCNTAIPDRTEAILRGGPVLATDGTVQSGVYGDALAQAGVEALYPSAPMQEQVMRLIYQGVKARAIPLASVPVEDIIRDLRDRGAEKLVLACTELPIAFRALGLTDGCLDPTRVLAFAAVKAAGAETTAPDPW